MFTSEMQAYLSTLLLPSEQEWLQNAINSQGFVMAPRKIRRVVEEYPAHFPWAKQANGQKWTLDRLVRVWIVTQLAEEEVHRLFITAEMREWVALVSALPWLNHPASWLLRATDAVRSNIGDVLDAIAQHNSYPAAYFPELAWNQLVLKVLFNDKPIQTIEGLTERQNPTLAQDILLLAQERWAAGRELTPHAWRLVAPFPSDLALKMALALLVRPKIEDQKAAQLVLFSFGKTEKPDFTWDDL
ncbi:MAG: EboA domain-containing protein [Spirosomataceae bacterium]